MKTIILFSLLLPTVLCAEEIERKKSNNLIVDESIQKLVNDYWSAALKKDTKKMESLSSNTSQFRIDKAIAKKLAGKKYKVKPTYFEKVTYKNTEVTYLLSVDFFAGKKAIDQRFDCQVLEKKNGQFKIIGHIGDCVE